ncbi:MAG: DoxX family protein [Rhodoplanes sp.]|jgi:putative oxidoreductase
MRPSDTPALVAATELAGRLLLAFLFLHEAWSKLSAFGAAGAYMEAYGVPALLLPLALAVELGAGLMIAFGYATRLAALALAGFCLLAALVFHTGFGERNQLLHFEKDLALAGAFLILAARGAGAFSLDALWSSAQKRHHRAETPDLSRAGDKSASSLRRKA